MVQENLTTGSMINELKWIVAVSVIWKYYVSEIIQGLFTKEKNFTVGFT